MVAAVGFAFGLGIGFVLGIAQFSQPTYRGNRTESRAGNTIPSMANRPSPTPGQEESIVTRKRFNPSGTLAFYFASEEPAFLALDDEWDEQLCLVDDDPFRICYNGDTPYRIPNTVLAAPTSATIINANVLDVAKNEVSKLSSVGDVRAPNGWVRITRWLDDTHLLRKAEYGDVGVQRCDYSLIDVKQDSAELIASNELAGVDWKADTLSNPEYLEGGSIIENRVGKFVFSQYCEQTALCQSISVFRDMPADTPFPYKPYKPLASIRTTQRMSPVDLETRENLASLGRKVTIHAGDGYFLFDLQKGEVLFSSFSK